MSSWTWNLIDEMERLRRDVDRAFRNENRASNLPYTAQSFLPGRAARSYPLFNIRENEDAFSIDALAPGLDPEQIKIYANRNVLSLSGVKKALPDNVKPEQVHRSERASGSFTREVTLPTEIDADKISAQYNDGLLRIKLPKKPEAKPKLINVKVG